VAARALLDVLPLGRLVLPELALVPRPPPARSALGPLSLSVGPVLAVLLRLLPRP